MNVNLIIIGRKMLEGASLNINRLSVMLSDKNYEITKIVYSDDGEDVSDAVEKTDDECVVVIYGESSQLRENSVNDESGGYFTIGLRTFVTMRSFDEGIVRNIVVPLLNAKSKTSYNTVVFKTFGKTEEDLRELLGELTKNRGRIGFSFPKGDSGIDVRIKYARGTSSSVITELIKNVSDALGDCVYALKDVPLAKQVARQLMSSGKKLCIAESFTGGGLASALVASPGMSSNLLESVVCYSNEAKAKRLGVPHEIIDSYGAVSADTAFEMANGLLSDPLCDVAVATTGNAGPTAERDGRVGLFYIAIGDRNAIHVFEQFYEVDNTDQKSVDEIRREITDVGIQTALYELGKYLKEKSQENPNG